MKVRALFNEKAVEHDERGDMDNPIPFDQAKFWNAADIGETIEGSLMSAYKKEHGIKDFRYALSGENTFKAAIGAVRKTHGDVVNVPINKIKAGEGGLYKAHVNAIMKGGEAVKSSEFPVFYKIGNEYFAIDGNHRIAAAFLQGHKNIQGLVMDIDKLGKQLRTRK